MLGGNKKVIHTQNQGHSYFILKAAGLFMYVCPFCYHQALKG